MYMILSAAAALVALVVAGFAVFAAYAYFRGNREPFRAALARWTAFDYVVLGLFVLGTLFLLADAVGVLRERDAYPFYHYGYLLSGLVYNALAGIFLFVRLGLTLKMLGQQAPSAEAGTGAAPASSGREAPAGDDHREPHQA